jgi:AraC-like DNA-binding protein
MDTFAGMLAGAHARGAFALRASLSSPWSLRIRAESPLTLLALVRGHAWVIPDRGEAIRLVEGDVALTRGPDHYSVADHPQTPTTVVIHPGQHCCTPEGEPLAERLHLGVRTWGNDPAGATQMLVGAYESAGDLSPRLLRALPPVLSLARAQWESPVVALLSDEMAKDLPGQAAVLDRLVNVLLIAVLRAWVTRPEAAEPAWRRSQSDPLVGRALEILHRDPARRWTLAGLARDVGALRAVLARRFQAVVGESPMRFLTAWRLALAADLLCEPDATLGAVAARVGYTTPYALSTAFKRVRGINPKEHRRRARAAA